MGKVLCCNICSCIDGYCLYFRYNFYIYLLLGEDIIMFPEAEQLAGIFRSKGFYIIFGMAALIIYALVRYFT